MKLEKVKEIYGLLGDDMSKYIFENRMLYSLTGDMKFIRNVACTVDGVKAIYSQLKNSTQKKVIFGAGMVGKRLVRVYNDIEFECLADSNHAGEMYRGLRIIGMGELKERYKDALIIISTNKFHGEIYQNMIREGFREENIVNIGKEYERLNHMQYFDLPQLNDKKMQKEVFVDGGCYDGATSVDFVNWHKNNTGGGYIYAWEPDPDNYSKCKEALEESGIKYTLIPKGLWNEAKSLKFKMDRTSSAILEDDGDIEIEVDSIDNVVKEPVTFIKMDIEGAEYQALLGARNTMAAYKPKLAICVYHKPEDIWELPCLIHEINPEYRFYLRHYSFGDVETVLYAL